MAEPACYPEFGHYSDLANILCRLRPPSNLPALDRALWFDLPDHSPQARVIDESIRDSLSIQTLEWSVGYGPVTQAYLIHPAEGAGPWPGVVALHDHGGFRWLGKEKIADGPEGRDAVLSWFPHVRTAYDDRAWANELARKGFAVLVHDVFSWGSRRFEPASLTELAWTGQTCPDPALSMSMESVNQYNTWANARESTCVKWLSMASVNLAAMLAWEDRMAAKVLLQQSCVCDEGLACIGFSGGGARAAALAATCDKVKATAIICMMSTYASLMQHRTAMHTFQLMPFGLHPTHDYPDIAASTCPHPLVVCFGSHDPGFARSGMKEADRSLRERYVQVDATGNYVGEFFKAGHEFNREMQERIANWLLAGNHPAVG